MRRVDLKGRLKPPPPSVCPLEETGRHPRMAVCTKKEECRRHCALHLASQLENEKPPVAVDPGSASFGAGTLHRMNADGSCSLIGTVQSLEISYERVRQSIERATGAPVLVADSLSHLVECDLADLGAREAARIVSGHHRAAAFAALYGAGPQRIREQFGVGTPLPNQGPLTLEELERLAGQQRQQPPQRSQHDYWSQNRRGGRRRY